MRPVKAATTAAATGSRPYSRKQAPMAASTSSARTVSDAASAAAPACRAPDSATSSSARPSSRPAAAQLARDTTCARMRARSPSGRSGNRSNRCRAMHSPSTLSPRNSRRSYERPRSATSDECANAAARRSAGSPSISARSSGVRGDVVDRLADRLDLLRVLVGDLHAELVLELHDQLDQVERVGVQVALERRALRHLILVDAELLHQDAADALQRFVSIHVAVSPISDSRTTETVLTESPSCKSDPGGADASRWPIRSTTPCSAPRAATSTALRIARRLLFPWAITEMPRTPSR